MIISIALIKYGYINFSITILEYCDKSGLNAIEQYCVDSLKPEYNILIISGSYFGYTHFQKSKNKISLALKGVYIRLGYIVESFHTNKRKVWVYKSFEKRTHYMVKTISILP